MTTEKIAKELIKIAQWSHRCNMSGNYVHIVGHEVNSLSTEVIILSNRRYRFHEKIWVWAIPQGYVPFKYVNYYYTVTYDIVEEFKRQSYKECMNDS